MAAVDALEEAAFGRHRYPYFFFRQALDALGELFFIAEAGEKPVAGYAVGCVTPGTSRAWVLSVAVDTDFRGLGMGRALLERLVGAFAAHGAEEAWLHVSPSNQAAVALYEDLGFRVHSECADYFGSGEDRLIMRKPLDGFKSPADRI